MQDVKRKELLNILRAQENPQNYKIFSFEELAGSFPNYLGADIDDAKECVTALELDGDISVKYRDDEQVCLSVIHTEDKNCDKSEINFKPSDKKGFLNAFLGGVTGGLIGAIITLACSFIGGR